MLIVHLKHRWYFMKKNNPPHTATHNGPYTSRCIISTKLVVHSTLAYEWCFSILLEKGLTSVNLFKIKLTPEIHHHGVPSCFPFQYELKQVVSQFK